MAKPKFPKTLYVERDENGDEEHFFLAQETTRGLAVVDGTVEVAVYELVKRVRLTAPTHLEDMKRR